LFANKQCEYRTRSVSQLPPTSLIIILRLEHRIESVNPRRNLKKLVGKHPAEKLLSLPHRRAWPHLQS